MTKEEELQDTLDGLDNIKGVEGSAIVRRDGLLIVSNLDSDIDADQLGAMTASTMGSGETASETLGIGSVDEVVIEAANGSLISVGAGEEAILTVLTGPDINKGLVLTEMQETARSIEEIM